MLTIQKHSQKFGEKNKKGFNNSFIYKIAPPSNIWEKKYDFLLLLLLYFFNYKNVKYKMHTCRNVEVLLCRKHFSSF